MSAAVGELNRLLVEAGQGPVTEEQLAQFKTYVELLVRWNARTNLTAIRDEAGIVERHFLESILVARLLPDGVESVLDFGSGAGFPGLPIAVVRRDLAVTLAESQGKKAVFLREAVRTLGVRAGVHAGRAEMLQQAFDCVVMRAVDHMEAAVPAAVGLVRPGGWLGVMTTSDEVDALKNLVGKTGREVRWECREMGGKVLLLGNCR